MLRDNLAFLTAIDAIYERVMNEDYEYIKDDKILDLALQLKINFNWAPLSNAWWARRSSGTW